VLLLHLCINTDTRCRNPKERGNESQQNYIYLYMVLDGPGIIVVLGYLLVVDMYPGHWRKENRSD
jgi:hypothetical protein